MYDETSKRNVTGAPAHPPAMAFWLADWAGCVRGDDKSLDLAFEER